MARLRSAMDSCFWDFNLSTPLALDGIARVVPGDPVPLDGARASKILRAEQLSLLRTGFPLGIIPSYSPPNRKDLGSFALQSFLTQASCGIWWAGLVGQIHPEKLISSIKADISAADEWDFPMIKETAKRFLDKSLYAIGLCSTIDLTPSTSLIFGTTKDGTENRRRSKAMLSHMLPDHDITLDAALPELFIDGKGNYWEVPLSVSLDCSSLVSESGLRYRFGIHKNSGLPQAVNSTNGESPVALLPGLCAKAAVSFEKSKDLWRKENDTSDLRNSQSKIPYDVRMWDPHSAISGIIGATSEAWFGSGKGSGPNAFRANDKFRLGADLFGSVCFTYQHGKFCDYFGDLTRIDARLDMSSASALVKKVYDLARSEQSSQSCNLRASPRLNLMFQQQVCGPIVFRVDSKFGLDSFAKNRPQLEDLIYSLNYSLRVLGSGKVVAWYSPKRKQGMVELRTFEF